MNNITIAFILTSISGLSTLLGIIPIYINFKNINKLISASLAFASGIMLSISIFSLIPESYIFINPLINNTSKIILISILILIGILLASIINIIFKKIDDKLYKLGIINSIALIIHNIPEGILTFSTTTTNINIGLKLALSIILHNIPEGISISIPIYYSTKNIKKVYFYTLVASLSEIFGALITYLFLYKIITNNLISIILSLTSGIMIYISLFELLPNSLKYKYKSTTYIFFLIGIIFMIFLNN